MILFVLSIIFLLAAAGGAAFSGKINVGTARNPEYKSFRKFALIPLALAVLFMIPSMLRTVDAGTVGVPVTFGNVGSNQMSEKTWEVKEMQAVINGKIVTLTTPRHHTTEWADIPGRK